MSEATLCVDRKARRVERAQLDAVPVPEPDGRWYPIGHSQVLDMVMDNMGQYGFQVEKQGLALSNDNAQFFGTLDLQSQVVPGVTLAVGVRNSIDKSLSAAMCLGERVFVCSNLCFGGEMQIARKHTRFAVRDFNGRIAEVVAEISQYREVAAARVTTLQRRILVPDAARATILRAAEKKIIGWRLLPKVLLEWDHPSHEAFEPRTAWSLLNCFTEVMKDRQGQFPADAARQSIQLQQMLAA